MKPANTSSRLYPAVPLLGASACIFDQDKILLVLGATPPKQDLWSLPGGLVEVGETLQQAAARELLEETGISADILGLADWAEVIRHEGDTVKYHFVIAMFVGYFKGGTLEAGDDAKDARWFSINDLTSLVLTKGTAERIKKAYAEWTDESL